MRPAGEEKRHVWLNVGCPPVQGRKGSWEARKAFSASIGLNVGHSGEGLALESSDYESTITYHSLYSVPRMNYTYNSQVRLVSILIVEHIDASARVQLLTRVKVPP